MIFTILWVTGRTENENHFSVTVPKYWANVNVYALKGRNTFIKISITKFRVSKVGALRIVWQLKNKKMQMNMNHPLWVKPLWEYNQNLLFQKYYNSHLFKWDQGITLFLISTEVEEGIELDYSKRWGLRKTLILKAVSKIYHPLPPKLHF